MVVTVRRRLKVFICGPFRGNEEANKEVAEQAAADVWRSGHIALCPHLNSPRRELIDGLPESLFLSGYLTLLRGCDAMLLLPGWHESEGARAEFSYAHMLSFRMFDRWTKPGWNPPSWWEDLSPWSKQP